MNRNTESYKNTYHLVINEVEKAFESIAPDEVAELIQEMQSADKIFVVGVGRVLISLQSWVKRFTQLGFKIYFVGEVVEPAITEKDLLIVGSGSGNSLFPVAIAKRAKELNAKVFHIGSNQNGNLHIYADFMLRIPAQTKLYLSDEVISHQPMTSLFEQVLYLLGDVISKMMIDEKNIDMKTLWQYHANLE